MPSRFIRPGYAARALGPLLSLAIFIADVSAPMGVALGLLYVIVILLGLRDPDERYAINAAVGTSLLTVIDPVVSAPGDWTTAVINRAAILLAIWVTAFLVRQQHRSARALEQRTRRTQEYLDVAGVMLVVLDRDLRVALMNRRGRDILGRSEDELIGRSWFDDFVPAEIRDERRAAHVRMLQGAEPPVPSEYSVLTRSGERRVISWHRAVLRDASGRVVGTLSSGEDVTDRRRAEDALRRSVKDLEDLKYALDQSAIVATTDVQGRITYVNQKFCEIAKYPAEELLGQDHRIINSGYHPKEFIRDLWQTIARGRIWRGEIRNRAKDGSIYWVDTTIVPFLDDCGKPFQYMAIRYEITERKRTEERLREQAALARLGEMAAIVAHEVKNPLAGIRGALQVIAGRLPADGRDRSIIGDILARLDSLNESVQDLLLFARPRPPKSAPVGVGTIVQSAAGLVRRDPAYAGVAIEVTGGDPVIQADAEQLHTVFLNLLINAAQAMNGQGRVRVSIETTNGRCRVAVQDQGPGIPLEVREKIFEPFFTTKHRGTGLGLPTAKRVVEMHGGEISVDSPPEGGTRVTVELPA